MTRLWTLSPSWPASGPSLMRKVIDSVGGSIGCAAIGLGHLGCADRVGDGGLGEAGDGDDVAGLGFVDRQALEAAEGEHLGDAALLDDLAVARQRLHRLFGLMVPEVMRPVRMRPR